MKEIVLVASTDDQLRACKSLITNPKFRELVNLLRTPFKTLLVNDERTKNILIRSNKSYIPFLFIDTEEGIMDVKGVSNILKFLGDMIRSQQITERQSNTKINLPKMETLTEEDESIIDKEDLEDSLMYRNTSHSVYYIECEKYIDGLDKMFTHVIIAESCKKVRPAGNNVYLINTTNIKSLKSLLPIFTDPTERQPSILVISKNDKLAAIMISLVMFYIEHRSIEDIQKATNLIIKKPLLDLFMIPEEDEVR